MEDNQNKVTSQALRDMAIGSEKPFALPTREPYLSRAVNSGKAIAYRLQRELECSFRVTTDFDNATMYITKLAKQ